MKHNSLLQNKQNPIYNEKQLSISIIGSLHNVHASPTLLSESGNDIGDDRVAINDLWFLNDYSALKTLKRRLNLKRSAKFAEFSSNCDIAVVSDWWQ